MKRVKKDGKSLSKFDLCAEIDRVHYSYAVALYSSLSYGEARARLLAVVLQYAPDTLSRYEYL